MHKLCSKADTTSKQHKIQINTRTQGKTEVTSFIIMLADGSAARFPLAPAANNKAASPQAFPTHSVKIGGSIILSQKYCCLVIYYNHLNNPSLQKKFGIKNSRCLFTP
jgi:hypothetical protein